MIFDTRIDTKRLILRCISDEDAPAMGQGYMEEACKEILAFGFLKLNLINIFACPRSDNISSVKLLERLKFKECSTFCECSGNDSEVEYCRYIKIR